MYTQICILRNPKMQDVKLLNSYGYMRFSTPKENIGPKKFLYVEKGRWQFINSYYKSIIDCGENRYIFQGLIAMDDNSITDQWLTNGEKWLWIKCSDYESILTTNKEVMLERLLIENYHKATAQEIIEHFKL